MYHQNSFDPNSNAVDVFELPQHNLHRFNLHQHLHHQPQQQQHIHHHQTATVPQYVYQPVQQHVQTIQGVQTAQTIQPLITNASFTYLPGKILKKF